MPKTIIQIGATLLSKWNENGKRNYEKMNTNNKIAIINNKQFKTFKKYIYLHIYFTRQIFMHNLKRKQTKKKKQKTNYIINVFALNV